MGTNKHMFIKHSEKPLDKNKTNFKINNSGNNF